MADGRGRAVTVSDAGFPNLHVSGHPLVRHKIRILADRRTDSKLFRELVNELTTLMVYEATTDLPVHRVLFQTPLEGAEGVEVAAGVGMVPILRAGLGRPDAARAILPQAEVWHLGF